ncbi:MAG TPA: STAS domain-containing protein [Humisphaera sp.]|nr:STAS domain-containing protein [Humisphaera sp.]
MPPKSALMFGRTEAGYRLRVEGRGTMPESKAAETFIDEAMTDSGQNVIIDLSGAEYLDSTFLGCLLGIYRKYGGRVRISAPKAVTRELFGPTMLDVALKVCEDFPPIVGSYIAIPSQAMNSRDMAWHIMECNRRLAEIPGPQQNAFAAIARQMARELEKRA